MVRYMWGTESENRVSTRCFHFKLFEIIDQYWSNTIFSHPILVAHGPLTPNTGQTLFLRPNTVRPLSFHFQLLATPRPFLCIILVFEGLSYPGLPRSSHNQYQSTTVFLHSITVNQCPLIPFYMSNTVSSYKNIFQAVFLHPILVDPQSFHAQDVPTTVITYETLVDCGSFTPNIV